MGEVEVRESSGVRDAVVEGEEGVEGEGVADG